ncbi:MAG: helix-turn-helix domain-containing protein [Chloroflexi bacterium]|jgi:excisionase family DNA binding protein|nr:helix-turn-helix domain-containing protein [Chloroflexota bacterium]
MQTKKLLSVQEAAEFLGVSRMKISKMLKSGALKGEINPLDTRERLIPMEQLTLLKGYPPAKEEEIYYPEPEELAEVKEAIVQSEAEKAKGFRITHEEITTRIAERIAAYRMGQEKAAS